MKLNKDQTGQLKKMISHKGYAEIDVQYEILDHVACRIEDMLSQKPDLSLEDAFAQVHASFGIFGFSSLEESYKKSIQHKSRKYITQALLKTWTSWKIVIPIFLSMLYFQLAMLNQQYLGDSIVGSILTSACFLLLLLYIFLGKYEKALKAYWNYASVGQSIRILSPLYLGIQFLFQFNRRLGNINIWDLSNMGYWHWLAIAIVFLTFSLLICVREGLEYSLARTKELESIYQST